ncbi:MAG: hypothetical protein JEZ06_03755 [Anaerolineaceae bacterium]|nr:hypothetical protein [Anaerolineaceae bacterium]
MSMQECIELMKKAFADLFAGNASDILRSFIKLPGDNIMSMMPGYVTREAVTGLKTLTVFPDNYKNNLPSHQGAVVLYNIENGELKAIVDATTITTIRTAAVSAVATDLLARKNARVLALLGAGVQARSHLEAIQYVREIKKVNIWNIIPEESARFKKEMEGKYPVEICISKTGEEACADADILCTLTPAKTPILFHAWLKKGAHINAVGSCFPTSREVDTEIIRNAKIYVDSRISAAAEAGDLLIPVVNGEITRVEDVIAGEISEIIHARPETIRTPDDLTLFESQGLAVEDITCANFLYQKAVSKDAGTQIDW